MKNTLTALLLACIGLAAAGPQPSRSLPKLRVSDNKRFLVTADGKPFFYLADTAWELLHRLNRKQAVEYLDLRAKQSLPRSRQSHSPNSTA